MSIKSLFENIADAIRETSGSSDTYTPAEMPDAIRNFNSIFQTKILSSPIEGETTVEGCLNALSEKTDLTYNTVSGNPVSFTTDSSGISKDTIVTLEPIQSGSGDPSPTNVRPISGYTEIEVNGCGVNVWDEEWELGSYNTISGAKQNRNDAIRSVNMIGITHGGKYYFLCSSHTQSHGVILYYDSNKDYLGYASSVLNTVWTAPENAHFITFYIAPETTYNHDISINYPSTDTSYHAYTGHRITSPLPSTIYGGTYDVEAGELTVDRALVDLGTLTWLYDSGGAYFKCNLFGKANGTTNCFAEIYPNAGDVAVAQMPDKSVRGSASSNGLIIKDSTYGSDAASFKTAMSGVKLAYELATPYTIQLEPHLLPLLSGVNTVTTNGNSIEVTYRKGLVARVDDFSAVADAINTIVTILENSNNT